MMPFDRPGSVAAYTTITSIQSVPTQDFSCPPTKWDCDLPFGAPSRGQSAATATDEQQAALQVLAGSSERAEADRARAILLTFSGRLPIGPRGEGQRVRVHSHVGITISHARHSASQSSRTSPLNWSRTKAFITMVPKPLRVGGLMDGLPTSVQWSTRRLSAASVRTPT